MIHPSAILIGDVEHNGSIIHAGCVVGDEGEHRDVDTDWSKPITIGEGSRLREHVVVQRGLVGERGTTIGERCYIMHGAHVAHDCLLEDGVTLSPYVVLGGHTTVMEGANIGIGAVIHQRVTIGSWAMVGMGAVVVDDVPPGWTVVGNPARFHNRNTIGLDRDMVTLERLGAELERFHKIRTRRMCRECPSS